jgi:murein L,D-transpeptidase YcbB/YkuD
VGIRILMVFLLVALTGCASTQSKNMTAQLQMRVGEMEKQIEMQNEEMSNLQEEVRELSYNIDRLGSTVRKEPLARSSSGSRTSVKDGEIIRVGVSGESVQKALKNAGYYQGNIDGKIGAKTQDAISQFQKDHGLKADGLVGRQTWTELKTYLN